MNRAWLLILILLLPSVAWGIDFGWDSPDEDRSIYYLGQIFGQMGNVLMGSGNQIIGDILRILNVAVLTVGTIVVVYSVVVSTISTAQEGEVMGKKFSSIWIPIRSAGGLALLLPTASGFSLIQILMMWIVIQGVHGANQMWALIMDKMAQGQGITTSLKVDTADMARQATGIFQAAVCIHRLNNDDSFQALVEGKQVEMYYPSDSNSKLYFGIDDPDSPFKTICGSAEAQPLSAFPHARNGEQWNRQQLAAAELSYISMTLDAKEAADWPERFYNDQDEYDREFGEDKWTGVGTLTDGAISMKGPMTMIDLRNKANDCGSPSDQGWRNFLDSMNMPEDVISTMVPPCTSEVFSAATQDGWIHAGNYFFKMIKASSGVNDKVPPPKFKKPPDALDSFNDWTKKVVPLSVKYLSNSDKKPPGTLRDINSINITQPPGLSTEAKTALSGAGNKFNGIAKDFIGHLSRRDNDPISSFQKTGTEIMITVEVLFFVIVIALPIAMTIACIGSGINPACFILGLVVVILMPVFIIILSLVWGAGVAIGLYLPMIPYFVYTFTALGWIMLVVETIVAAPIVALGITTPGQEALGKATPAVLLITNVFLRPSLMVIGLIAATRLLTPVIHMINYGFEGFVMLNVGELLLFGNIVLIVIYAGIAITAFHQIFSLVYVLPDKVIRWIGGQAEQSQVEKMLQDAEKASQAGADTAAKLAKAAGSAAADKAKEHVQANLQALSQAGGEGEGEGEGEGKKGGKKGGGGGGGGGMSLDAPPGGDGDGPPKPPDPAGGLAGLAEGIGSGVQKGDDTAPLKLPGGGGPPGGPGGPGGPPGMPGEDDEAGDVTQGLPGGGGQGQGKKPKPPVNVPGMDDGGGDDGGGDDGGPMGGLPKPPGGGGKGGGGGGGMPGGGGGMPGGS